MRKLCLSYPNVYEKLSHGSPTFFCKKGVFVSFVDNHHGDGRVAIWCNASDGAQEVLVGSDPGNFFIPPYVGVRGWIGVRLDRRLPWDVVKSVVADAYAHTMARRR